MPGFQREGTSKGGNRPFDPYPFARKTSTHRAVSRREKLMFLLLFLARSLRLLFSQAIVVRKALCNGFRKSPQKIFPRRTPWNGFSFAIYHGFDGPIDTHVSRTPFPEICPGVWCLPSAVHFTLDFACGLWGPFSLGNEHLEKVHKVITKSTAFKGTF